MSKTASIILEIDAPMHSNMALLYSSRNAAHTAFSCFDLAGWMLDSFAKGDNTKYTFRMHIFNKMTKKKIFLAAVQ